MLWDPVALIMAKQSRETSAGSAEAFLPAWRLTQLMRKERPVSSHSDLRDSLALILS